MKQPKWVSPENRTKMRTEPCRVYIRGEYSRIREPLIFERRRAKPRGTIFHFPYEYLTAFGSKIRNNFTIPLMLVGTNIEHYNNSKIIANLGPESRQIFQNRMLQKLPR